MTFISYAENFEDVMLWRALEHVNEGFYIDVGAGGPENDSITKAFYDRGWCGINTALLEVCHRRLSAVRMRDTNLLMAAGAEFEPNELVVCELCGQALPSNESVSLHQANGHTGYLCRVPVVPLKDVCAQYVKSEIHFLKIDAGGLEVEAIKGMDFEKYRPWILVIKATKPNSDEEFHHFWESFILSKGYHMAYADGLNRFYLAPEKLDLLHKFRYPPNSNDSYIKVQRLELEAESARAKARATQAEVEKNEAAMQLGAVYNSHSWRVTAPLRWLVHQWRLIQRQGFAAHAKSLIKHGLARGVLFIYARPTLKSICIKAAYQFGVAHSLRRFTPRSQLQEKISSFEDLRSVRIMFALSKLSQRKHSEVVAFLEVDSEHE